MKSQQVKKIIENLPDTPGVYLFVRGKGTSSKILYIGKATSLRDRVRSYFNTDIVTTRSPLISKMLSEFDHITFDQTDSVLEALVLEADLIKKYQPEANIKEKDNRSFNFVVITREAFPRVLIVRGRELEVSRTALDIRSQISKAVFDTSTNIAYSFGPFPNGSQLREAMKIVRKLFPYRDKCTPPIPTRRVGIGEPCFNRQIGLCPGVCTGEISEKEYTETIKNIILFFESNKKKLIKNLEKQMKISAKARDFEKAGKIKKTIFTLNHIQDISLIKDIDHLGGVSRTALDMRSQVSKAVFDTKFRIESYDIAHLSGTHMVGVMTVVEYGEIKISEYRKFKIRDNAGANDTKALSEILTRRLTHIEWPMPNLIVVDGGVGQKNMMEKVLKKYRLDTPVVSVVKDDRHKAREILGDKKWLVYEREILLSNAEAHRYAIAFHKKLRGKIA